MQELEGFYGRPDPPQVRDPWEMILWENVAYLVDDGRRAAAFRQLRDEVGFEPESILAAQPEMLLRVLLRFGFGEKSSNYSTSYRSVQQQLKEAAGTDFGQLVVDYLLLRRHGHETCRRSQPACGYCPLAPNCTYSLRSRSGFADPER